MKHRPLFWIAVTFIAGGVLSDLTAFPLGAWLASAAVAGAACAGLLLRLKADQLHAPFLFLLFLLLGGLHHEAQNLVPSTHIVGVAPDTGRNLAQVEGVVRSRPRIREWGARPGSSGGSDDSFILTQFAIESAVLWSTGREGHRFDGKIQVGVTGELPEIRLGDRVRCLGWLSRPGLPSNPGEFNFRHFLARRGILAQLRVGQAANVQVLSRGHGAGVRSMLSRLNRACEKLLFRSLAHREAALLDGLLLGNRDQIRPEHEEDFTATGTRHILAISGLHVGLITSGVLGILLLAQTPIRIANPAAVFFAFFYAFFSGGNTPSVRAAVMISVFLIAPLFRRKSDSLNLLGLSALLIVGFDANQVFSAGFQLSYCAVLGILLLTDQFHQLFRRKSLTDLLIEPQQRDLVRRWLRNYAVLSLCVTAAAWLGTLGLAAYYFNRVTPLAVFANLFVCPLVFLILLAGVISLAVSWVIPVLGGAGLWLTGCLAWLLQEFVHLWAQIPLAHVYVASPSLLSIALYYTFLLAVACRGVLRLDARRLVVVGCVLAGIHAVHLNLGSEEEQGRMTMTVLDVGHGCAAFLELPDGSNLLYDVGAWGHGDIVRRTIAPFLWQKGLKRVDRIVVSHLDYDHYSGLEGVLQRFPVDNLILTPACALRPDGRALIRKAKGYGSVVSFAADGNCLLEGEGWKLEVLHPPSDTGEALFLSDNDGSLVLKATLGKISFLLCGDIEEEGIERLSENEKRLPADVVLVPHHGGKCGNAGEFVRLVRPRYAIASAWANGPNSETLAEYRKRGVRMYITGRDGSVTVSTDGGQVLCRTFLEVR